MAGALGGILGGGGAGGLGGLGSLLGGLGGGSKGGATSGTPNGPYQGSTGSVNSYGSYQGISSALSDGQVIGDDVLKETALQGTGPADHNLIRNIFGTIFGDPGTPDKIVKGPKGRDGKYKKVVQPGRPRRAGIFGGFVGGTIQALIGGTMGFIQNKGIEAIVAAAAAAAATGATPEEAAHAATAAFLAAGGAYAVAGAADQGLRGFRKGGGMAAAQTIAHEVSGNIAPIADRLTNGAVGQALGGIGERPSGQRPMNGTLPVAGGGDGAAGDGNVQRLLTALNAERGRSGTDSDVDTPLTAVDTEKAMKKLKAKGITAEMIAKTGLSIEALATQKDGGISTVKKANLATQDPSKLLKDLAKKGITSQMIASSGKSLESYASEAAA